MRDTEPKELIRQVRTDNYRVHGAQKFWREPTRRGHQAARRTAERLMREPGIAGAVRGKRVLTTLPDQQPGRAPDRVDRGFVAGAPNRCRVADFTPAATWAAVVTSPLPSTPAPAGASAGPPRHRRRPGSPWTL
ncbi:IS3 family transposase [Streptomyces sp. NPDC055186]